MVIAAVLAAVVLLAQTWGVRTDEGGLVEQVQLAALLAAAALWLGVAYSARPTPPRCWAFAPLIAGVCLTGIGREASWGGIWGASEAAVTAATALNAGILGILLAVSVRRGLRARFRPQVDLAGSPWAVLAAALVTFGASDLFEKHLLAVPRPQLTEEALELAAFGLLALAALEAGRRPS